MIIDQVNEESNGKKIIEVLIEGDGVSLWIPVMGTDLRIMSRNCELSKVKEIHVRNLEEEK